MNEDLLEILRLCYRFQSELEAHKAYVNELIVLHPEHRAKMEERLQAHGMRLFHIQESVYRPLEEALQRGKDFQLALTQFLNSQRKV